MAQYISDELFHFVGGRHPGNDEQSYAVLRSVLIDGCIAHDKNIKGWGTTSIKLDLSKSLATGEMLIPTVTCYCDIPVEHLGIHITKYGRFGLSFEKACLIKFGARPVIYVPLRDDDFLSPVHGGLSWLRDLEDTYRGFLQHILEKTGTPAVPRKFGGIPASAEEAAIALNDVLMRHFFAFIKPFNSSLPEDHQNNFYYEREWRKFGNFEFNATDVRKIMVAQDFLARFEQEFPQLRDKVIAAPI